jgi:hypothetical protein
MFDEPPDYAENMARMSLYIAEQLEAQAMAEERDRRHMHAAALRYEAGRYREAARDSDTRPKDGDAQQGSARE